MVQEIDFESGAVVSKGDLLVRLDTSSESSTQSIEARVQLAQVNLQRVRTLSEENMISSRSWIPPRPRLNSIRVMPRPFSQQFVRKRFAPLLPAAGIRQINLGQNLDIGKAIVSLQSLTPIYVEFSLPQQELARLKTGMAIHVSTDAYPGRDFDGSLTAINPDLDPATRSVAFRPRWPTPSSDDVPACLPVCRSSWKRRKTCW